GRDRLRAIFALGSRLRLEAGFGKGTTNQRHGLRERRTAAPTLAHFGTAKHRPTGTAASGLNPGSEPVIGYHTPSSFRLVADGHGAKIHLPQSGPVCLCHFRFATCGDLRAIRVSDRRALLKRGSSWRDRNYSHAVFVPIIALCSPLDRQSSRVALS